MTSALPQSVKVLHRCWSCTKSAATPFKRHLSSNPPSLNPIRAKTIYSPTPSFLSSVLSSSPPSSDGLTLYTLSTSLPSLPDLLPPLQSLPNSIGSFTHAPPGSAPFLSIAHFPRTNPSGSGSGTVGKVWRSSLTGRGPVEVGRWHRPKKGGVEREDKKGDEVGDLGGLGGRGGLRGVRQSGGSQGMDMGGVGAMDWGEVWEPDVAVGRIDELEGINAETLIVLSDASPRPVLRSLDSMFPSATKAGLITAPTPFLTGRPHTLLVNGQVFSEGSVGIALPYKLDLGVEYNLEPMGTVMHVERSQGNMLLSLDNNPNPTQVLIQLIQKRGGQGLSKEEDFYLALLNPDGSISEGVRIMSGDPSRGALSLEMEASLVPGQAVQFMQRRKSTPAVPLTPSALTFGALSRSDVEEEHAPGEPRVEDGFLAFSEGGFIYSSISGGKSSTAVATSAGGFAQLASSR